MELALDGITAPTQLVAFDMVFFTQPSMSDDVAYQVTKTLYENKAGLAATFPAFNLFDPGKMAKTVRDVPFHPGAIKFYREVGLLPKS